jgi:hypothetical protein
VKCLVPLALGALLISCGQDPESSPPEPVSAFLRNPLSDLPNTLSEVGIYPHSDSLVPSKRAISYRPGFELWSDGGVKQRELVLPEGEQIDASDPEAYTFPLGTLVFKTFSFRTPDSPERPVPVETRLLRQTQEGWELSAYAWNQAATDAELLDLKRSRPVEVLTDDGEVVEHAIPSRLECRQCHESAPSMILGLNELQLARSDTLEGLASRLSPPPPADPERLPDHGELTSAVLGYLVGNCTHCHNGTNGAASSFDLRPNVALRNLIGVPTESSATADGVRVVPGEPEQSILLLAVRGSGELEVKDMPPLGVALRDTTAVELLDRWITALGEHEDP